MASSLLLLVLGALGGALMLWSSVARTKEASELLLDEYEKLLTEARELAMREKKGDEKEEVESDA